jgi:hypothetical protein
VAHNKDHLSNMSTAASRGSSCEALDRSDKASDDDECDKEDSNGEVEGDNLRCASYKACWWRRALSRF